MRVKCICLYACALLVCATTQIYAGSLTDLRTVFLIMMENEGWPDIVGNINAPFMNGVLLPQASHCEQYYSEPVGNTLWYEAGTNFGIIYPADPFTNNCQTISQAQTTTNHFTTYLNNAGISWKAYLEDCPANTIEMAGYNHYVVRHNPFAYFTDVTGTNIYDNCTATYAYGVQHMRPYTDFAPDLTNNAVARYNFIVPNLCHDMHDDCAPSYNRMAQGDAWLASEIPRIMNSPAYQNNGAIFITFDEPFSNGSDPVPMIVVSPLAKGGGYASTLHYSPSSTLRTMQEIFPVGPFLGGAATATDLSDLFQPAQPSIQALQISSVSLQPGGLFSLVVTNVIPGATNFVETSTDLLHWNTVSTNSVPTNTFSFDDTIADPLRFYRVSAAN